MGKTEEEGRCEGWGESCCEVGVGWGYAQGLQGEIEKGRLQFLNSSLLFVGSVWALSTSLGGMRELWAKERSTGS